MGPKSKYFLRLSHLYFAPSKFQILPNIFLCRIYLFLVFRLWIKDSMGMFGWAPKFWPTIYFWCWQLICSNLTIQGDIATMNIHFCTKISKPVNNTLTNVSLICSIILILVSDNVCLISNWNKIGMFKENAQILILLIIVIKTILSKTIVFGTLSFRLPQWI